MQIHFNCFWKRKERNLHTITILKVRLPLKPAIWNWKQEAWSTNIYYRGMYKHLSGRLLSIQFKIWHSPHRLLLGSMMLKVLKDCNHSWCIICQLYEPVLFETFGRDIKKVHWSKEQRNYVLICEKLRVANRLREFWSVVFRIRSPDKMGEISLHTNKFFYRFLHTSTSFRRH